MNDRLTGAALVLAVLLVAGLAVERSGSMVLARADWACARTRDSFVVRREPLPGGGSMPKLVAVSICAAWERR